MLSLSQAVLIHLDCTLVYKVYHWRMKRMLNMLTVCILTFRIFVMTILFIPVNCQKEIKGWEKKKADIYFLVVASPSVYIRDYREQLNLVADLVNDMDIGHNYIRVGLGVYSDRFTQHIPLNNNMTKAQLVQKINETPLLRGEVYVSRGLYGLRTQGLTPQVWRSDVSHISVLFTDTESKYLQLSNENASLAKQDDIHLFTVSVGKRVSWNELLLISSAPHSDYIFQVDDFVSLTNINSSLYAKISQIELLQKEQGTCGEKTHLDVEFLFDEYGYGRLASNKIKKFLQNITEYLSINSGHIRVGIVSKTCHKGEISFNQNLKREQIIASLNDDSGPDIVSLLKHVRKNVFKNNISARDFAKNRIVAFLYGDTSSNAEVLKEFVRNKDKGRVEIFVVYSNTDYKKAYVEELATSPQHALFLNSTDELFTKKSEFLKMFCQGI